MPTFNKESISDIPVAIKNQSPRFIDRYRKWLRLNGYAYETEKTYIHWVVKFIRFNTLKHPEVMGNHEVSLFLENGALKRSWSPSTQRTALNALANLYNKFLQVELGNLEYRFARTQKRLPVVMSHEEAILVISHMQGDKKLIAQLMYGTGLRISEVLRLRIKDIDFALNQIIVRGGKGDKDRTTLLPNSLKEPLHNRILRTKKSHETDILLGLGSVYLPYALAAKYPKAEHEFIWQFLFPSQNISTDPRSGIKRRHHIYPSQVSRAIKQACLSAKLNKRITSHCFRHSFATKLAMDGVHLTQIQKLLGHTSIETTEIYLHIAEQMGLSVSSPMDS